MNELIEQIDSQLYPIAFVNLLPIDGIKGGHAVVVVAVSQKYVSVYDPLYGKRALPRLTFETAWSMMHNLAIVVRP